MKYIKRLENSVVSFFFFFFTFCVDVEDGVQAGGNLDINIAVYWDNFCLYKVFQ